VLASVCEYINLPGQKHRRFLVTHFFNARAATTYTDRFLVYVLCLFSTQLIEEFSGILTEHNASDLPQYSNPTSSCYRCICFCGCPHVLPNILHNLSRQPLSLHPRVCRPCVPARQFAVGRSGAYLSLLSVYPREVLQP